MKNKNYYLYIAITIVILSIASYFIFKNQNPTKKRQAIYNFDVSKCPGETIKFKMEDPYLRGILEQGEEVSVVLNAFACENIQKDQLVLYRYTEFEPPVIRRVVAEPGDSFSIDFKKGSGWFLKVNQKVVTGVKGEVYYYGGELPPPLALAAKPRKGIVGKNECIILSSFPPGDRDSGMFGILSTKDIIGKVIKN